jgi:hypothetical protein
MDEIIAGELDDEHEENCQLYGWSKAMKVGICPECGVDKGQKHLSGCPLIRNQLDIWRGPQDVPSWYDPGDCSCD